MASVTRLIRHYWFKAPLDILDEKRFENPYLLGKLYSFFTRKRPPYFLRKHSLPFLVWKMIRKFMNVSVIPFIPFNVIRIACWRCVGFHIGSHVFIGMRCYLDDCRPELLTIGDNVTISYDVRFAVHGIYRGVYSVKPIVIEEGAYIGLGSIILAGVTIGKGSQIGAGSVVRKSIPERVIAAGVPARVLYGKDDLKS